MLEVAGLSVRYDAVDAVRGVALSVGAGEVVGLLGPNGAGKTSILRSISRLVPSRGSIHFDGVDISSADPTRVTRLGLIHVPEGRRVFGTLSVKENLLVGSTARRGRPELFSLADVYDLFPPLGLLKDRAGWALSGGEQQMVAIGRALMGSPRLLLLDEPSLGLAPIVTEAVFEVLGDISKTVPMLLVEQNTSIALEYCARAYVLVGGRVVLSGAAAELSDSHALLESYLGQETATPG
jgi:branched-chain amino acid transport system ATP-binding protein